MELSKTLFATVLLGLSTAALANEAASSAMDYASPSIKVNCNSNPKALKNALERRVRDADKLRFVIAGECHGPLVIERNGVEISGDSRQNASLRVLQNGGEDAAILVRSANVKLSNFNIAVPNGVSAVKAKANATVHLNEITTDAKSDWNAPRAQFIATDSSSLFLANLKGAEVLVIGASSADFETGNSALELDVRDTSAAKSSGTGNHFKRVQLSANAYLLADNQARIDALGIWGKSSAEITRQSSVGNLGMGGQTLFAAYANSTVTGPYGIYGNVVFELNESSAKCWPKLDKPHSLFVGNNATVNGTLYPSWSWAGQSETDPDPACAK